MTLLALEALRVLPRAGPAVCLAVVTLVPIAANRKIAPVFSEDSVFGKTSFAWFLDRRDPAGSYRTIGLVGYRPDSPLGLTHAGNDTGDLEFSRRLWNQYTPALWRRGMVFNGDFDREIFRGCRACAASPQWRPRSATLRPFFGALALRWEIRFRDQEPLPGYHPVRTDGLMDWDEHENPFPDIRLLTSWREESGALPALSAVPTQTAGQIVIESGATRLGAARPGRLRILEKSPERLRIEAEAPDPTWLFALRGYWNYRAVLLDGRPVEDAPAQLAFSAVAAPCRPPHDRVDGARAGSYGIPLGAGTLRACRRASSLALRRQSRKGMRHRRLAGLVLVLIALLAGGGCRKEKSRRQRSTLEADQTRPPAEWLRSEPVRLLRDYVRLDTTDEKGEEEGAKFLKRFFDCAGIENEIVCPAPKRCNLLARLPGRSRKGALLLLNHIDVVRAFPSYWKEASPFGGEIKNGYLYGRGAYDMKSLGLAEALAMRNLKDHGIVPSSDVLFLAEADEEAGQRWGSRWLFEHRPEWFDGVEVVLNEGGTNEMILRDVRFWGIETVQAGYGLIEFEAPAAGAIEDLARRWPKIHSEAVQPLPDVVAGFDMLANHLGHPLTDPLRHLDRVRRDPAELAILPDRYGCFLEARIKWTGPYPYPGERDKFRGYVVVSTPPGISPDPFLDPVESDAARSGIRVVEKLSSGKTNASPYLSPSGHLVAFLDLIRRVTEARYPGIPFGPVPTFGASTTSIYFRQRGTACYGYSPIPANIADSGRRHGNDERIFLRDYVNGVEAYRDVLLEFAFYDGNKTSRQEARN